MSILSQFETYRNTWNVYRKRDSLNIYGYIAQDSQFYNEAIADGWEILVSDCEPETAIRIRDMYKDTEPVTMTPDLSDLMIYRIDDIEELPVQEFDIVSAKCHDTIYRTGTILSWNLNSNTAIIEVGSTIHFVYADTIELVASLEWLDEYTDWAEGLYDEYADEIQEAFTGAVA